MTQQMSIQEFKALQSAAKPQREHHHVESYIQKECVKWFRLQYPQFRNILFAVPNEAAGHNGRILSEGVVAGVADILFLFPSKGFHGLCIEFKTQKGKQSDAQKAWQSDAEKQGYKYCIVRNFTQFYELITFWMT